jgi:hypothetical protein
MIWLLAQLLLLLCMLYCQQQEHLIMHMDAAAKEHH